MKVEIIKCLKDNYSYLLINEKNKNACVIDPSESKPIIDFVEKMTGPQRKTRHIRLLKCGGSCPRSAAGAPPSQR